MVDERFERLFLLSVFLVVTCMLARTGRKLASFLWIRRFVLVAGAAILVGCVCVLLVGFAELLLKPDFGFHRDYDNLSYEEYRDIVGLDAGAGSSLMHLGATDIKMTIDSTRDGYDGWSRMIVSEVDYDALLQKMMDSVEIQNRELDKDRQIRAIRINEIKNAAMPDYWPISKNRPDWWHLNRGLVSTCVCSAWEQQLNKNNYSRRGKGWYWLYCRESKELWLYAWNCQFIDLGKPMN